MKAHVLTQPHQLVYKDVPLPILNSGEALVKVGAAGICSSDIERVYGKGPYHYPIILGHEFAGKVEAVYDQLDDYLIGKRVAVYPLLPCHKCAACQHKQYEMCESYSYLGSRCDGGFAEYVKVPVWNLQYIPDRFTYEEAALMEPAAVALHAVNQAELHKEDKVLIYGLGVVGILIAQWLHSSGINNVYAYGRKVQNGLLMKQVSSEDFEYFDEKDGDLKEWLHNEKGIHGIDIAIDCSSTSRSIADCIGLVKGGGQIIAVGNPKDEIHLSQNEYWKILRHQIKLKGSWNSNYRHEPYDEWYVALMGRLRLSEMISHRLAFDSLEQGLILMKEKKEYFSKIIISKEID